MFLVLGRHFLQPSRPSSLLGNLSARLSNQIVGDIVQRHTNEIGKYTSRLGAHSLRAGIIRSAAIAGVPKRRFKIRVVTNA